MLGAQLKDPDSVAPRATAHYDVSAGGAHRSPDRSALGQHLIELYDGDLDRDLHMRTLATRLASPK
jgi:hypothetical protein